MTALAGARRERALVRQGRGGAAAEGGPCHHRRPERGRGAQPPRGHRPRRGCCARQYLWCPDILIITMPLPTSAPDILVKAICWISPCLGFFLLGVLKPQSCGSQRNRQYLPLLCLPAHPLYRPPTINLSPRAAHVLWISAR